MMTRSPRVGAAVAVAAAAVAGVVTATNMASPGPAAASSMASPYAVLAALQVRPEDTGAHYRREDWGTGWSTVVGCSTRERVLQRDAVPGTLTIGPNCAALAGTWISMYDGVTVHDARALQIDHVVPLAEAQRSGARGWTAADRRAFYLDPANLRAVTVRANEAKRDGDPPRWMPPSRAGWCRYAITWVATKARYRLTVDPAEAVRLREMLGTCPAGAR